MNQQQLSVLVDSVSRLPFHIRPVVSLSYGTSGFTDDASSLESTAFLMGVMAALMSIHTRSVVGLMISASDNQVSVNGVQIFDPSGGLLPQSWATYADTLANAFDLPLIIGSLDDIVKMETIILEGAPKGEVLLGRDTRPSGKNLLEAAKQGVTSFMGTTASDVGIITTPQLRSMVCAKNLGH